MNHPLFDEYEYCREQYIRAREAPVGVRITRLELEKYADVLDAASEALLKIKALFAAEANPERCQAAISDALEAACEAQVMSSRIRARVAPPKGSP